MFNVLLKSLRIVLAIFLVGIAAIQIFNFLTVLLTNSYKRFDIPITTETIFVNHTEKPFFPLVRLYYEGSFMCSGVVVSDTLVLTAAHCVVSPSQTMPDEGIVVSDIFEQYFVPTVVAYYDKLRDVAILYGDFRFFQAAKVDWSGEFQEDLKNADIVTCGFPGGDVLYCSKIKYATNFYFKMLFSGGQLYKGMSGGPVLIDVNGEKVVIGVNSAVYLTYTIIGPIVGIRRIMEN